MHILITLTMLLRWIALAVALSVCLGCDSRAEQFKALLEPRKAPDCAIGYVFDGTSALAQQPDLRFELPEDAIETALLGGGSVTLTAIEVNTAKGGIPRELGQWNWKLQSRRGIGPSRRQEIESIKQAIGNNLRKAQTTLATPIPLYQSYLAQGLDFASASMGKGSNKFVFLVTDLFECSGGEKLSRSRLTPGVNFELNIPTYDQWANVLKASGWLAEGSLAGVHVTALLSGPTLLIPGPKGTRHDPVELRAVEALWSQACTNAGGTFTTSQAKRI